MSRPLRVVAAFHRSEPSGPSRSLQPVLERLADAGSTVVVTLPDAGTAATELARAGRVEIARHEPLIVPRDRRALAALVPRLRADARRFRALLRRERADLAIIATTTLPALVLAARLEGVPSIVYAAELYRQGSPGDTVRERLGRSAIRLNERLATVVVPCSHTVAAVLRDPARSVVVFPALDPGVAHGDAATFRARHRLPPGGPVLATLGNISRGRGQDVALRAFAELRDEWPDARLVIAGSPQPGTPDEAYALEIAMLADTLGVADAVHLVGFVRPGDLYAVADIVLNPARVAETFGIVATEALAAGRPVVSTAVGAVPEVLRHEEHALLVPPDRPDALASAVRRLLTDPALAARLVAAGGAHVRDRFDAGRQLPRFDEAIELALRRHAAAGTA